MRAPAFALLTCSVPVDTVYRRDRKSSFVLCICNFFSLFCPSIQGQLTKAQEETGTLKLQLQTVSVHVHTPSSFPL